MFSLQIITKEEKRKEVTHIYTNNWIIKAYPKTPLLIVGESLSFGAEKGEEGGDRRLICKEQRIKRAEERGVLEGFI